MPVSSAVLVEETRVVRAAAQERFSGKKRDSSFPADALRFVKGEGRVDYYAVAGEELPAPLSSEKTLLYPLDLSLAASSFFASPFDEAGILVVDLHTGGIYTGKGLEIYPQERWDFPHTPGFFCSAMTQFLGFTPGEGDFKVMGLAGYGSPSFYHRIKKAVELGDGFSIKEEFFNVEGGRLFTPRLSSLLGVKPASNLERPVGPYPDLAASVQAIFEEVLLSLAKRAVDISGTRNLVLAGSHALNGLANYRLVRELGVNLYVQPEAGAGGASLGAAYLAWVEKKGCRPSPLLEPFLGEQYREGLKEVVERYGLKAENLSLQRLIVKTAEYLAKGKVLGWFRGRFEWGPRALGARSILADPRRAEMKEIVNLRIKRREPFRPFAPTVIEERAMEFFALPEGARYPLGFMQMVVPVLSEEIPAVTHVDRTARPQVIRREFNRDFYSLIEAFAETTGVPVVLNTSFNLKGRPIVANPEQALMTFLETELDALVLEDYFIERG